MNEGFYYIVSSACFSADGNQSFFCYSPPYTGNAADYPKKSKATFRSVRERSLCSPVFPPQNKARYCVRGYLENLSSYSKTHRRRRNFVCSCFGKNVYSLCYSTEELEMLKEKSTNSSLRSFSDSINLMYDIYDKRAKEKTILDMFLFG